MAITFATGQTMTFRLDGKSNERDVMPVNTDVTFSEYFMEFYDGAIESSAAGRIPCEGGCKVWVSDNNYMTSKYARRCERQIWIASLDGGNSYGWTFRDSNPLDMNTTTYQHVNNRLLCGCWGNPTFGYISGEDRDLPIATKTVKVWCDYSGAHEGTMRVTEAVSI